MKIIRDRTQLPEPMDGQIVLCLRGYKRGFWVASRKHLQGLVPGTFFGGAAWHHETLIAVLRALIA